MNRVKLRKWADLHSDGLVDASSDRGRSLSSRLLRFRWRGAPTIAVDSDADGKTRINVVVDGLAYFLATATGADDTLNIILGIDPATVETPKIREHLDAIGTVAAHVTGGPRVKVWHITDVVDEPKEVAPRAAQFSTPSPKRWAEMLNRAAVAPVDGLAMNLLVQADRPALALYPKLSSKNEKLPWQLRLDGLDIGRVGPESGVLRLASNLTAPGEPRVTWRDVVGKNAVPFTLKELPTVVVLIKELIVRWTKPLAGVLQHAQAEHALEAHILSGRLPLTAGGTRLHPAIATDDGALRVAQFPTLWGDVTRPARYLDALLKDDEGRPWAVELKDQNAGGGHGAYLRHGVTQAVLYRHYIRSADALDAWFSARSLDRTECQSALAFPDPSDGAAKTIGSLELLAPLLDVCVIRFPRP